MCVFFFFFQAEDGIRDLVRSRGLGDVYKRQLEDRIAAAYAKWNMIGMVVEANSIGQGVIDHLHNLSLIHI